MGFDYDDNLKENKRKNTNPTRFTNILVIVGFVVLAGLMIAMMYLQPVSSTKITDANIEATIDARLANYIEQQAITNPILTEDSASVIPVYDSPTLEPRPVVKGFHLTNGTIAEGTLSDDQFSVEYTFNGQANTPIIITLRGITLEAPALILTHPNGQRMVSSLTIQQPSQREDVQVIGAILPTDGQYIVTATRKGGRAGDSTGDYTLTLDIPTRLKATSSLVSTASNQTWDWYIYEGDKPFIITYELEEGEFKPEVSIYNLTISGDFERQAYLPIGQLSYATLGMFEHSTLYWISVGEQSVHSSVPSNNDSNFIGSYTIGIMPTQ